MSVVSLVPSQDRPYVDGSCNNSIFSQVFLYNGAGRLTGDLLDQPGCSRPPVGRVTSTSGGAPTRSLPAVDPDDSSTARSAGKQTWLFVPSLVALGGILIGAPPRAAAPTPAGGGAALGGVADPHLVYSFVLCILNGYYLAALAPPLAALCGLGFALAWRLRAARLASYRFSVMATTAAGVGYALWLVPDRAGVRPWIIATSALTAAGAIGLLALSLRRGRRPWERSTGLALALAALLLGGVWASATVVGDELRPLRLALPTGAGDRGGAGGVAPDGRRLGRGGGQAGAVPHGGERRGQRVLGAGERRRAGDRPRVPPRGRVLRPGAGDSVGGRSSATCAIATWATCWSGPIRSPAIPTCGGCGRTAAPKRCRGQRCARMPGCPPVPLSPFGCGRVTAPPRALRRRGSAGWRWQSRWSRWPCRRTTTTTLVEQHLGAGHVHGGEDVARRLAAALMVDEEVHEVDDDRGQQRAEQALQGGPRT